MTRNHIGVDLSKDWLDVFDPRRGAQRITSRASEIRAWLAGLDGTDCLVFEATSGCDDAVMRGVRGPRASLLPGQSAPRLAFRPLAEPAEDGPDRRPDAGPPWGRPRAFAHAASRRGA